MINNFTLIIDTREQQINHIIKYAKLNNINYIFKKLDYGDYSFSIKGKSFEKQFAIERKGSLDELAGNLGKNRKRFKNEFYRAKEDNAKVILLIEKIDGFEAIKRHDYISKLHPNAFLGSLESWRKKELIHKIYFVRKNLSLKFMISLFEKFLSETYSENEKNKIIC